MDSVEIEQIGPHVLRHGDVMDGIGGLMGNDTAQIVYSDPPWGAGNLKYWQTMNHKMTGAPRRAVNYERFLNQIFTIAKTYAEQFFFLEYGVGWREDITIMGKRYGFINNGIVPLKYKSGSRWLPLDIHLFTKLPHRFDAEYRRALKLTADMNTLRAAVGPVARPGHIILDPCCGMGYTAQIALETGMIFRGNEINARRLEKTKNRLRRGIRDEQRSGPGAS